MSNNFGHKNHNRQDNYVPPYDASLLAEPVGNAGFSQEVVTKLQNGKVNLMLDVVKRTEKEMYRINTFNKKNLFEVKRVLQGKKLNFKPEPIKDENAVKVPPVQDKKDLSQHQNNDHRIAKEQGRPMPNNNLGQSQNTQDTASTRPQQKGRGGRDNLNSRNNRPQSDRQTELSAQRNNADRKNNNNQTGRNRPNPKQEREDRNKINPKQQNKRIWDSDGVSEQHTKNEREKSRPQKPAVNVPRDIFVKINKNDKWGFANRLGKEVVPPVYDEVFVYKEDLCCVEKEGLFGYIDREGNEVIPIEYDCALSFSEGYACVYKNNKCGYINKNNEIIIDFKYDAGTSIIDGNCRIKKDGKWGELFLDNPNEIRWI